MSSLQRHLRLGAAFALVWGGNVGATTQPTTLHVMVQTGFAPTLSKLKPQLESRLNLKLQLTERHAPQIFAHLSAANTADVVIVHHDGSLHQLEAQQHIRQGSITPIVSSQMVLWCPSDRVNMRISIHDTLKAMHRVTLALPPRQAPATRTIWPYLLMLPKSVRIVYADSALESWRHAYHQKADCAVTLKNLVAQPSLTRYRAFPNTITHISAAISQYSPHAAEASRLIQLLNVPLIRRQVQALSYQ
jgi:hypothetical protein